MIYGVFMPVGCFSGLDQGKEIIHCCILGLVSVLSDYYKPTKRSKYEII